MAPPWPPSRVVLKWAWRGPWSSDRETRDKTHEPGLFDAAHQKAGWRPIGATCIPALWDGGNGTRCTAVAWMQGLSPVSWLWSGGARRASWASSAMGQRSDSAGLMDDGCEAGWPADSYNASMDTSIGKYRSNSAGCREQRCMGGRKGE